MDHPWVLEPPPVPDWRKPLLATLADGEYHTAERLGLGVGLGRSALGQRVKQLQTLGVAVCATVGRGYQIAGGLDLLDEDKIWAALHPTEVGALRSLEVHLTLDSTSRYLLDYARQGGRGPCACLAEYQTMGRGRRGDKWVSPFASGLCLSLLWPFERNPSHLAGLSLAVGVTIAEALEAFGVDGVGVKWPNDLHWSGRKLAGVLIELVGKGGSPTHCVIGVGLNVRVPEAAAQARDTIDQPWVDLAATGCALLSRNHLAALLLARLMGALRRFDVAGFTPFLPAWRRRDVLAGRSLMVQQADGQLVRGVGGGVNEGGALVLADDGRTHLITSGQVRIADGNR